MATMTVKNIPEELYALLKQAAARHRRSMNSEAIVRLEQALTAEAPPAGNVLDRVRQLRPDAARLFVTDEDLREARQQGRP